MTNAPSRIFAPAFAASFAAFADLVGVFFSCFAAVRCSLCCCLYILLLLGRLLLFVLSVVFAALFVFAA